ncbi:MAG: DUF4157 domain-containing protein [bacterium]
MKHSAKDSSRAAEKVKGSVAKPSVESQQHPERSALSALQQAAGNQAVADLLGRGGQPLEANTRRAMEASFGKSFTDVRVHIHDAGDAAARETGARALAVGRDIAFREGEYEPDTLTGQRLIAHELTHVVQQRNAAVDISTLEPQGSAAEREADATAGEVTAGRAAKPVSAAPQGIPRDVGFTQRGEISDPHGLGYNTILARAGPDSKNAVLALSSLEMSGIYPNTVTYGKLDLQVRKSILGLERHADGTTCAGWFDMLRANDPDFKPKFTPEQIRAGEAAYHAANREAAQQKKVEAAKAALPTLDPVAIDAQWAGNKSGFIAAAQSPNHGIKAAALQAIWVKYWADKIAVADATLSALIATELRDHVDRTDSETYRKATQVNELGGYLLADSSGALEICRAAEAAGHSLTLDEITERVISHSEFMAGMQMLALALSMGREPRGAKPAAGKGEPAKTEVKPAARKPEVKPAAPKAEVAPAAPKPDVVLAPPKPEVVPAAPKPEVKPETPTVPKPKAPTRPAPPLESEPDAKKAPEVKNEPEVKKEPEANKQPAATKPAPKTDPEGQKPPESNASTAANKQTRLNEIRTERAANDATIREKSEKRAASQQRSRDAAAKIPNAAEAEKSALRDARDRNAATADRLKDEIDRLRIHNNALAAEEAQLAPGVVKPQTWQEAENALRKEFGGQKKTFVLSGSNREVDCHSPDGIAREGKFGPQGLSSEIQGEINKDIQLVKSGAVKGVEWHFYENPQTGIGPSGPLRDALRDANFKIIIH